MDRLSILETIEKTNPWHKTGVVPVDQLEKFKRREFFKIRDRLDDFNMAELVIGSRRVGKSVMMYQLIQHLLDNKVDPQRVLFVQGDNPILGEIETENTILREVLELYQKFVLKESFGELSGAIYVFVDEAHRLDEWQVDVKTMMDLKPKVKFFVTGSSSYELRRGSQSPMVGRVNVELLPPFSFLDFVRYKLDANDETDEVSTILIKASDNFREALMNGDAESVCQITSSLSPFVSDSKIRNKFDQYLESGGFPLTLRQDVNTRSKYLRDLLTMTLSGDILRKTEIREPQAFERLIINVCLSIGSRLSFKALAEKIGLDERSVLKYLDHYAESHWVSISSCYSFSTKQQSVRTDKKVYVLDPGVVNVLTFKDIDDLKKDRSYRGHLVENVLYNHLLTWKRSIVGPYQSDLPYWHEDSKGWEIDYIIEVPGGVIPIECKIKNDVSEQDVKPVKHFLSRRNSAKIGIVTNENGVLIDGKVVHIPYLILILLI